MSTFAAETNQDASVDDYSTKIFNLPQRQKTIIDAINLSRSVNSIVPLLCDHCRTLLKQSINRNLQKI